MLFFVSLLSETSQTGERKTNMFDSHNFSINIFFFSINYSCCKNRSAEGNSCLLRVRNVIFFVAKEEKQGKINSKTFDLFRFKVTSMFD